MRGVLKAVSVLLVGWAALGLSACNSNNSSSAFVVRVDVSPAAATVAKGGTVQLLAEAVYSDGSTQDVTAQASWASSNPTAVSVGNAGTTRGLATGLQDDASVTITAIFDQVLGTATVTVAPAAPVRIDVTPATGSVIKGRTLQLQATLVFSDNSTQNVTAQATWSSNATSFATVSNTPGNKGLVSGVMDREAPVAISAAFQNVNGQSFITVTPPVPVSIEVEPATLSLPLGSTQQLVATAILTDDSTQDVTEQASWQSSAPGVVAVSNTAGTKGEVTALAQSGTPATITATLQDLTATAQVTVTAAVLAEIQVTPVDPQVPAGLTQQLTATGIYTDNSSQNLTATAQWSSSDATVATVGNDAGDKGLVTGVAASETPATITAAVGGVSGTTEVTVTSGVVQQIDVQPATASLPRFGFKQRYTATGRLSDGGTIDLSSQVTWSKSAADNVVTISNSGSERGVATSGNTAGTSQITATLGGVTSAPATLTVTNAALQSIEMQTDDDPEPETTLTLGLGRTFDVRAVGVFTTTSGGATTTSRQDITDSVTWSSCVAGFPPCTEADSVATVSNATGTKGRIVTQSPGSANIGARITINDGTTSTTRTGAIALTVTDATLVSLDVSPSSRTLPRLFETPFTATGTFTDGSTADVTAQVTWVTSNSNIVTISNADGRRGVARGGSAGSAVITARQPNSSIEDSAQVTVTAATLTGITVAPANGTIKQGQTQRYTATGQFSDSSTLDITDFNAIDWGSSNPSVADFVSGADQPNEITGLAQGGPIAVTATKNLPDSDPVSGSTNLTVAGFALAGVFIVPATDDGCAADAAEFEPMPRGYRRGFLACARYFNGVVDDVTASAIWSTQAPAVVTVSNSTGSKGQATASASATIGEQGVIRAQYTEDGITEDGTYTVRIVAVESLEIDTETDLGNPLPAGTVVPFTATASFRDSNDDVVVVDVTEQSIWTSSTTAVATISNSAGTRGQATVVAASGTNPPTQTNITATFGGAASDALTITRAN
jgi:trimeric autotransporter adhesin